MTEAPEIVRPRAENNNVGDGPRLLHLHSVESGLDLDLVICVIPAQIIWLRYGSMDTLPSGCLDTGFEGISTRTAPAI